MSKVVAGVAMAILSGVTVSGGGGLIYIGLKQSSGDTVKDEREAEPTLLDREIPSDLEEFQNNGHAEGCVSSLFGTISPFKDTNATLADQDMQSDTFLGTRTNGCLVFNRDTKSNKNGETLEKWAGNLRFLWAVRGESKGFVIFLLGTTKKESDKGKIDWSGAVYLMEGANTAGSATKKAAAQTGASFPGTETNTNKFPKAANILALENNPELWGFFTQVSDLSKVVADTELSNPTQISLKEYWSWEGQTGPDAQNKHKLSGWTKNIDDWWPVVFGADAFKTHAKTAVDKQIGTWTRRVPQTPGNRSNSG